MIWLTEKLLSLTAASNPELLSLTTASTSPVTSLREAGRVVSSLRYAAERV